MIKIFIVALVVLLATVALGILAVLSVINIFYFTITGTTWLMPGAESYLAIIVIGFVSGIAGLFCLNLYFKIVDI